MLLLALRPAAGEGCRARDQRVAGQGSKFIEQALGQRIGEQLTAEFHQATAEEEHLRQQG
ncbi:MAG: hypothetical protein ABSG86_18095 [Thermoguttaceae bacterium]